MRGAIDLNQVRCKRRMQHIGVKPVQDGPSTSNASTRRFLAEGGSAEQSSARIRHAAELGWIVTYLKFTDAGAAMFA